MGGVGQLALEMVSLIKAEGRIEGGEAQARPSGRISGEQGSAGTL